MRLVEVHTSWSDTHVNKKNIINKKKRVYLL